MYYKEVNKYVVSYKLKKFFYSLFFKFFDYFIVHIFLQGWQALFTYFITYHVTCEKSILIFIIVTIMDVDGMNKNQNVHISEKLGIIEYSFIFAVALFLFSKCKSALFCTRILTNS